MKIMPKKHLSGEILVPGDKSISHRAVMLGAIAEGTTTIHGFLPGADCLSTIECFRQLGISINREESCVTVEGKGLHGLRAGESLLFVGNSGTTMRLMSGLLAGQEFDSTLDGDASIRRRPMDRVIRPLTMMGGDIRGEEGKGTAPLRIHGVPLHGISYASPVASAQVKSAVLLAGLYAEGETSVTEPALSRDHTERMLTAFGAKVKRDGYTVAVESGPRLISRELLVPGDISSAAYFIAAGLLSKSGELLIKNVGVNPTRDGILRTAEAMGGKLVRINEREASGEPVCDLLVKNSALKGTEICGELIPTLIDEIPIIAVMAACAEGETLIRDAGELRVKESDRIDSIVTALTSLGVEAEALPDGMRIKGSGISSGEIDSKGDHRIAMAFSVAGLSAEGPVTIRGAECVSISYPGFFEDLNRLGS